MEKTVDSGISIKLLAKNKKVIPIYFKTDDVWHSNIKLPDVIVCNNSNEIAEIKEITITGFVENRKAVAFIQDEEQIKQVITEANQLLNKYTQKPVSQWKEYNLHILFGDVQHTQEKFEETNHLTPNTITCLRVQDLCYFHYVGVEKIGEIVCQIKIMSEAGEAVIEIPILLTPYKCKGDYVFPIKGSATILGTPWNCVEGHRIVTSQEFAFDVADFRLDKNGGYALSSPSNSNRVEDYFIFEREVLAIGDGIVVAVGNQWPNEQVDNPLEYSVERIIEITQHLLKEGVDFNHAILGNYVIIDHSNGEFSLYAHMSESSFTADVGDVVKQGQIIGRVGNTSNSTSPHLHFQLMDSKDFQTGNGLPVTFKNLPAGKAPFYDFEETNSLLYSDYMFINIPE